MEPATGLGSAKVARGGSLMCSFNESVGRSRRAMPDDKTNSRFGDQIRWTNPSFDGFLTCDDLRRIPHVSRLGPSPGFLSIQMAMAMEWERRTRHCHFLQVTLGSLTQRFEWKQCKLGCNFSFCAQSRLARGIASWMDAVRFRKMTEKERFALAPVGLLDNLEQLTSDPSAMILII